MSGKVDVGKNTIFNTLKSIFSVLYPLITFPYVSRVLQTENIGKVNFSSSIVSYFSLFASLGVSMYAVRECSKYKEDRDALEKVTGEILSINLFSTIIAYIALVITLVWARSLDNYRLLIIIQSTNILFTTFGADWINTAMEDFKYITIRTIAVQFISLFFMFVFIRHQDDYIKYVILSVIASSGANILNIFYRRRFCRTHLTLNNQWRKHLPPILRLFAMLCAQSILTSCDTTIIGLILGDYSTGLYTTALKVYNILVTLTASITWVVVPQLSYAFSKNDREAIEKLFVYCLNYSFVLGIPLAVGMSSLSREIILVIGGASYAGASSVLLYLSITYVLTLFSNFFLNVYMLASGHDRVSMISCVVAAVLNLFGNLWLIPKFGINAAAWTTAVSQLSIIIICYSYRNKEIRILPLMKNAIQPLLASVALFFVVIISKLLTDNNYFRLMSSMIIGGVIYFGLLYVMKNQFITGMKEKVLNRRG